MDEGQVVVLISESSSTYRIMRVRANGRLDLIALADDGEPDGEIIPDQSPYQYRLKRSDEDDPSKVKLLESLGSEYRRNVEEALLTYDISYKLRRGGREDIFEFYVAKKDFAKAKKAIDDFYASR